MPVTAANIRFQDYQFKLAVPAFGVWYWTTRSDVSGSRPSFQIREIISPYGILRDTIPIPGDVIKAMADSIDQIASNFQPQILVGPPTSLTFVVDEGRGVSASQSVILTNSGVYGSLLGTTLTTSAVYVDVTPGTVGNLAANEAGSFAVSVDSANLLSSGSPYSETVTITDTDATNSPQTLPVTITVRPKSTITTNVVERDFTVARPLTGSFPSIPTQTITITNTGPSGSVLDLQVQRLTGLSGDWLVSFTPTTAVLASGASQVVTITVAPIDGFPAGTFTETLRISGFSTNLFVDVLIKLVVT